jgi:prepilin-type N-terminal cleavage/methylation domain-containing protein
MRTTHSTDDADHRPQGGFTLVEVLVVVGIIGILANLSIPLIEGQLWRARAADIIGDLHQFEKAYVEYERDHGEMPANGTAAKAARDFNSYLDSGFHWVWPHANVPAYVWENWEDKAHGQRLNIRYGFSLKEPPDELVAAIQKIYDGPFEKTVYNKWTFVLARF